MGFYFFFLKTESGYCDANCDERYKYRYVLRGTRGKEIEDYLILKGYIID